MEQFEDRSFVSEGRRKASMVSLQQMFIFCLTLTVIGVVLFSFHLVFPDLADGMSWLFIAGAGTLIAAFYSWVITPQRSSGWLGVVAFFIIPPCAFMMLVVLICGA